MLNYIINPEELAPNKYFPDIVMIECISSKDKIGEIDNQTLTNHQTYDISKENFTISL